VRPWLQLIAWALLAAAPANAHGPQQVVIDKLVYAPADITMHVGDRLTWVNQDPIAHTATAGKWELMLPAGKTVDFTPTQAGVIDYHCRFHPNMKGRVTVLDK
jgi:plastocyanin